MGQFVFKLQSLLNLKSQIEDNLRNEMAKALRKLADEKRRLKALERQEEEKIREFGIKVSRGVPVEELKRHNAYISFLRGKIAGQKENVNRARLHVDKVRGELVRAMQERKMLDKLKEKQYKVFMREQFKKEMRLNDEIVTYKQSLKNTGEENG